MAVALACYGAYLAYRVACTLNPAAPVFAAVVVLAEAHVFVVLCALAYVVSAPRVHRVLPVADPAMRVDVIVVCRPGPRTALARTLRALAHRHHPGHVAVIGESPGDRADPHRAWHAAVAASDADAIVTLAAGDIPCTTLLTRTLGAFADPTVGWVCVAPPASTAASPAGARGRRTGRADAERRAVADVILPGLDARGVVPFTREGAVVRRTLVADITTPALRDATDAHLTGTLLARGWRGAYVAAHLVSTLDRPDPKRLEGDDLRRVADALVAAASMRAAQWRALAPAQRVALAAWMGAWTLGLPRVVFGLTPAWMAAGGASPARPLDVAVVVLFSAMAASLMVALAVVGRGHGWLVVDEAFNLGRGLRSLRGLLAALPILPRPVKTVLCAPRVLPLGMLLLNAGAAVVFLVRAPHFHASIGVVVHALATAWAVYNAAVLGWFVATHGAPAPRGAATRDVSLAATLAVGDSGHVGVLRDLSPAGADLLWPHPLEPGTMIDLQVSCAGTPVRVAVRVTRVTRRSGVGRWYAHDCRFVEGDAAFDALDTHTLDLQVAHANATEVTPSRTRWSLRRRLGRAPRHRVNLPVRFTVATRTVLTVTRDLSATGLSILTEHPSQVGDQHALAIVAPEQRWIGHVTVARCERVTDGVDGPVYLWGLRFDALDSQRDIGRFREWIAA